MLAPRSASRSFELQQNKIQTGTEIWPEFWGLRAVLNPSHKTGILFKGKLNHVYLDLSCTQIRGRTPPAPSRLSVLQGRPPRRRPRHCPRRVSICDQVVFFKTSNDHSRVGVNNCACACDVRIRRSLASRSEQLAGHAHATSGSAQADAGPCALHRSRE